MSDLSDIVHNLAWCCPTCRFLFDTNTDPEGCPGCGHPLVPSATPSQDPPLVIRDPWERA